jgi:hypothetical protein
MSVVEQAPALHLIGGFELRVAGRAVPLATNARRLLAFLAVSGSAQRRDAVAGRLWGWSTQARARATLRTALWRVRQTSEYVVRADRDAIGLRPTVRLDLAESTALAHELLGGSQRTPAIRAADFFVEDLLPGWDDDWLLLERERHRQLPQPTTHIVRPVRRRDRRRLPRHRRRAASRVGAPYPYQCPPRGRQSARGRAPALDVLAAARRAIGCPPVRRDAGPTPLLMTADAAPA